MQSERLPSYDGTRLVILVPTRERDPSSVVSRSYCGNGPCSFSEQPKHSAATSINICSVLFSPLLRSHLPILYFNNHEFCCFETQSQILHILLLKNYIL